MKLSSEQLSVFAAVYAWRDRKARALDEGAHYVMSKRVLQELARAMPSSVSAVRGLISPTAHGYSAAEEVR